MKLVVDVGYILSSMVILQVQVFSYFGQYFCLHFKAFQLQPWGTGRKMICQGVPQSIIHSHRRVRDSYDGLIIQRNMALFFSGGDRKELKLRVPDLRCFYPQQFPRDDHGGRRPPRSCWSSPSLATADLSNDEQGTL